MKKRTLRDPIKAAEWFSLNPKERIRSKRLEAKYGITLADRDAIAKGQDYRCEICKTEQYLVTDHDHSKPEPSYRALLCVACNLMLGFAKDNVEILLAAIDYINRKRDLES